MPAAPDAELLSRFVQGDQAAFEHLFRHFEGEVKFLVGSLNAEVGIA